MKPILSLLIVFCSMSALAQKWAPKGMTWTYEYVGDLWEHKNNTSIVTWVAEDTMTMKGHLCTIIKPKAGYVDIDNMLTTIITYEDSGRVYWYSPFSDNFSVLYDFNKNVGESWFIYGLQRNKLDTVNCALKITVKSVGVDTINGIPLKSLLVTSSPGGQSFDGKIIQGIGHLERPRPWVIQVCSFVTDIAYDYFGLRCIDMGSIGFHDFKRAPYCDWLPTSVPILNNNAPTITLSPNPSNGTINIKSANNIEQADVKVYNMLGQCVFQSLVTFNQNEVKVHIPEQSGIYLFLLNNKNGNTIREQIMIY